MSSQIILEFWQKGSISLLATFIVMAALIPLSHRRGFVDIPSGRKDHASPTPVIGGLAMGVGIFVTGFMYQVSASGPDRPFAAYALAGGLLLITGLLDDKYDLPWWLRICIQAVAALIIATWGGVRAEHLGPLFGSTPVSLGIWSIPFTVFATVGLINALNMTDGMDGFAGSLCLSAVFMLGAGALYSGNVALAQDASIICGALLAFLYFNLRFPWRKRARAFMGNGGSAFLGLTVAWVTFRLTQTPGHPVTPVLALWLIPIPLMDCLVLMTHRIRRGTSPFKADHNHIHHLMRDAGIGPMRAVLIACGFSLLTGLTAALALRRDFNDLSLLVAFVGLLTLWYWLTAKRERALALLRLLKTASRQVEERQDTDTMTSVSMESDSRR